MRLFGSKAIQWLPRFISSEESDRSCWPAACTEQRVIQVSTCFKRDVCGNSLRQVARRPCTDISLNSERGCLADLQAIKRGQYLIIEDGVRDRTRRVGRPSLIRHEL